MELEFLSTELDIGKRLDVLVTAWLKEFSLTEEGLILVPSRSRVSQWIETGLVTVNSKVTEKPSYRVSVNELVKIVVPAPEPLELTPDPSVEFEILFEDSDILVINKPAGLVVHPGAGNKSGTLIHGLLAHFNSSLAVSKFQHPGEKIRPGIVHRLDKDTSGVMVVAKTDESFHSLVAQFLPPRVIKREYLALTRKLPTGESLSGEISQPIGRDPRQRTKMSVVAQGGKDALTYWNLQEQLAEGNLLRLVLATGRTHQIRVHLAAAKAPIVGDSLYGEPIINFPSHLRGHVKEFNRQALHAFVLELVHPKIGERMSFMAPIPDDMRCLIELFRG